MKILSHYEVKTIVAHQASKLKFKIHTSWICSLYLNFCLATTLEIWENKENL